MPTREWAVAVDVDEVHDLLCACDLRQAVESGTPVPARRFETTKRRVESGAVHVLTEDGVAIATFTLTDEAPFPPDPGRFPEPAKPMYLQRLAVRPDLLASGAVVGVQCVRKAIELASAAGADALRCEANPDLVGTFTLLTTLGFRQQGPVYFSHTDAKRTYLQRDLITARR